MSLSTLSLEGQVAIITGGGTGIGRAIALEFAEAGADVVVAGRRRALLEEVAEEVRALGRRCLAVQTDISKKADVDNLVQRMMDEFGKIDILVNNAGIIIRRPLLETTEDEWDKVIDIDLKGYWLCCQAVGKRMVERKKGNVINVSSTSGLSSRSGSSPYNIAKAGVFMLTRGLARELADYNIRVNAIAPAWVETEMTQRSWSDPDALKRIEAEIPLGRLAEPGDIIGSALFLASDASSYITGHTIIFDGGLYA